MIQISIDNAVQKLKDKWRTTNIDFIKLKLKQGVTKELMRLEERKLTRREQQEKERKAKAAKEREEENAEIRSMATSMSGSPFKIGREA